MTTLGKLGATCSLYIGAGLLMALWTLPSAGQEIHADHCLHGCPAGSPTTNDIVVRNIYVLSSNDVTKFADWVAYRVTSSTIGKSQERFMRADSVLAKSETLEYADYYKAHATLGTDRGHQAPLASFSGTPFWEETNLLSNITPQRSTLNQGAWRLLETAVRRLAKASETRGVYVITGPLYERPMPYLPHADEVHLMPSGYWKIIATKDGDNTRTAAFIFEQETERSADYCEERFQTDIRTIERKTRLNFFHALNVQKQDSLESGLNTLLADLGCTTGGGEK